MYEVANSYDNHRTDSGFADVGRIARVLSLRDAAAGKILSPPNPRRMSRVVERNYTDRRVHRDRDGDQRTNRAVHGAGFCWRADLCRSGVKADRAADLSTERGASGK